MSNKYKHIKIPAPLISGESHYTPPPKRDMRKFTGPAISTQKKSILRGVKGINKVFREREDALRIESDKQFREFKIKFVGPINKKIVEKYRISIYKEEEDKNENATLFGKISDRKLTHQSKSDFDRLNEDLRDYCQTNRLKSYFKKVKQIKPITLEEVIEKELNDKFNIAPSTALYVDVSFAGEREVVGQKIISIQQEFSRKFISQVNSELVHFCRLKADLNDVKLLVSGYDGIVNIEQMPQYQMFTSSGEQDLETTEIIPPAAGGDPAFILDHAINADHLVLKDAVIDCIGSTSGDKTHGTAVASLVVCGTGLKLSGRVKQDNSIISVNVLEDIKTLEATILSIVDQFKNSYGMLLFNLSFNNYCLLYRRKEVDKFTVLLDEISSKNNCIFFISAGNLFQCMEPAMTSRIQGMGYPGYYRLPFCRILPPADSINNISVGSLTYQESVDSLTKVKNPSAITRANLENVSFIKPDFVHYDSNHNNSFEPEYNGVYLASGNTNQLTKSYGTSFAAPLVLHDACILHNFYPDYNKNTIKALLVHFADPINADSIRDKKIKNQLVGFGVPNLERAKYSLNTSSTIVIEDEIGLNKKKIVKFPIPACISGSSRKRLRIKKTLVYDPMVNPQNTKLYNPINISVQFVREDDTCLDSFSTRSTYDGAHSKSNVKSYPCLELSTTKHYGEFWHLSIFCECKLSDVPADYKQKYSIVLSIEDIERDDSIDIHEEISNMIEIESHVNVPIEV